MQLFGSTKYTLMLHTIFENGCYARSQVYPGHYVFRFCEKNISEDNQNRFSEELPNEVLMSSNHKTCFSFALG